MPQPSSIARVLESILVAPTAPYFENRMARAIRKHLEKMGARVRTDRHGNMLAVVGSARRAKLAYCAHMDHPGFRVRKVRGKTVDAEFLGGVSREFFRRGTRVALFSDDGTQIARARVVSTAGRWPKKKWVRLRTVRGDPARARFGTWDLPSFQLRAGRVHARACDDLVGCAAILAALEELARRKKSAMGLFTRREEVGLCGAFEVAKSRLLAKRIVVVSIETSRELCNARQGDGPIVRVGDRASIFHPGLTAGLCEAAARVRRLRWQRRLMDGGTCEATAFNLHGYRASGLCIALGNYHNCGAGGRILAENVHLGDLTGMVRLMVEVESVLQLPRIHRLGR